MSIDVIHLLWRKAGRGQCPFHGPPAPLAVLGWGGDVEGIRSLTKAAEIRQWLCPPPTGVLLGLKEQYPCPLPEHKAVTLGIERAGSGGGIGVAG